MIDWTVALREGSEPPLTPVEGRFRVLLLASRVLVGRGLAAVLGESPDFDVCAEVNGLTAAASLAVEHRPDLALICLDEDSDALEAVQRVTDWSERQIGGRLRTALRGLLGG